DHLVARLKVLKPNLIVLEATGGLETVVAAALAGAGLPVAVANPGQIRAFAKAIWPARQDRPDRCRRDRSLRRGNGCRTKAAAGPSPPAARRSRRPPSSDHRHDRRGAAA